jgi:dUTP pyrophosphatase
MTIKILEKTPGCMPEIFKVGDWIDLFTAEDITLKAPQANKMHIRGKNKENTGERIRDVDFESTLIPLGVCIQVPNGYEACLLPRSSTFLKWGIIQTNSQGVIDNLYCGNDDEWKLPVLATKAITIPKGTRIAQFRIQLSQKATLWQKLKWLLSSGVRIKEVQSLDNPSRDGFGSTGN